MATRSKTEAIIEDLYKVPGKAELINGEIIHMPPTEVAPGVAGDEILSSLLAYMKLMKNGIAVGDNKAFIVNLPNHKSFSPHTEYYYGKMTGGFYEGAPAFAVEVRSEGDYGPAAERRIKGKRKDYFDAGTQVVWDVDVLREDVVRIYRADNPEHPTTYHRGEVAEAEPAVPGWTVKVDDLFFEEQS